jgi:hypothetical protein
MRIVCLTSLRELEPYADDWDRLAAGMPFRTWTWLSGWWRHYGPLRDADVMRLQLAVLCAFDDAETLVGIAPWYLETSTLRGRMLKALGSGEVCSDYLGILCQPSLSDLVCEAMAEFLVEQNHSDDSAALRWDLLNLDGIDAGDREITALAMHLAQNGCTAYQRPGPSCWRLSLPTQWDAYFGSLSKNLRRDAKRMDRDYINTGRAVLHSVEGLGQLPYAMNVLLELHQRRRRTLGEAGCFNSVRFTTFYRNVVPRLFCQGQVDFYWLELDGKPVAAEYQLVGNGILYEYQAGLDPDAMECQPGKLLNLAILRRAIERGYHQYDFLRGDEPYKARFGAQARPNIELRIVPHSSGARLRNRLWLAGSNMKQWLNHARNCMTTHGQGHGTPHDGVSPIAPNYFHAMPAAAMVCNMQTDAQQTCDRPMCDPPTCDSSTVGSHACDIQSVSEPTTPHTTSDS